MNSVPPTSFIAAASSIRKGLPSKPTCLRCFPNCRTASRAIYTYIKRTAIYPSFVTFDAAERQLSTPRRLPTNTPLQALVTLNDPAFQEAAEALAARMEKQSGPLDERIDYGGRWVLSRHLSAGERQTLRKLHNAAGMTAVASALLNLDAALTR